MAKTVFDVLIDKIDEEISSARVFLSGGLQRTTPSTRKLLA
jgi:hypothetical protein